MRRLASLTVLIALTAACGSDNTPVSPTNPTVRDSTFFPLGTETEPLGHLTVNGSATYDFGIVAAGAIEARLTTLSDSTATVSLAIGTWNGTGCQLSITNDRAPLNTLITGAASTGGSYCVRIADAGRLTDAVDYKIKVTYPKCFGLTGQTSCPE